MSPYIFHTRVSYSDIDHDLNLSMAGAMRLMQEAAIIHSDQSHFSVMDVERTRVVWMLVQWRVRILGTAKWNETIRIITWPQTMEKLTSSRCFRIEKEDGEVIAVAESNWLLVNVDTGRVMRIPPEVAEAYELISDGVFDTPVQKLGQAVGEETYCCHVQRRDIDTNHHVNNLIYLEYAKEALPDSLANTAFPEIIVRYHRQLLLGDPVHCYYQKTDDGHLVQICGEDPRQIHCSVYYRNI